MCALKFQQQQQSCMSKMNLLFFEFTLWTLIFILEKIIQQFQFSAVICTTSTSSILSKTNEIL